MLRNYELSAFQTLIRRIFYLHPMHKMLLCYFILTFLSIINVSAQVDDYRDTTGYEFPKFRNEVMVNVNPAFLLALGGESINPRWSVGYGRFIRPNLGLRAWINWEILEDISEDKSTGKIIPTGSETFEYRLRDYYDQRLDLRLGIQFSKPKSRISPVYGADVFFGFRNRDLNNRTLPYELDTSLCATCYRPSLSLAEKSEDRSEQYFITGLDFSIGCLFKAGKRIWLTLQWSPELNYISLVDEEFSDPELRSSAFSNGLNFNLRGVELFTAIRF